MKAKDEAASISIHKLQLSLSLQVDIIENWSLFARIGILETQLASKAIKSDSVTAQVLLVSFLVFQKSYVALFGSCLVRLMGAPALILQPLIR